MNRHPLILLLFASLLFQTCSEDELATSQKTKTPVSFSIDEKTSAEIPDGSSLLISINSTTGQEVYSDHALMLTRKDGVLISESIGLEAMEFALAEFMILHNEEVIYASPKAGSVMAEKVSKPLSHNFIASGKSQLNIPVEVAEARNSDAEKFGYSSFRKKAKNTFQIIAYFHNNDGIKTPLFSELQIKNEDAAFYYTMVDNINTFTFDGDHNDKYMLTAYRPGFYRETIEFRLNKLNGRNSLIEIVLERTDPTDVVTLTAFENWVDFTLGMVGVGSIDTDFGNGSGQYGSFPSNPTISIPPDTSYMRFARDELNEDQVVTISGDLDQVVSFENTSAMGAIDVTRLPNLSKLTFRNASTPNLDLTQNAKLRYLALISSRIDNIQLNRNAEVAEVHIERLFSGADALISEVYENAVTLNITGGSISLVDQTISESSAQILSDLQNNYNWAVTILNNP